MRRSRRATALVCFVAIAASPLLAEAAPTIHLPEPARVQARHRQHADGARGRRIGDAAAALGLRGIVGAGMSETPGALYGKPGAGNIPGQTDAEAARNFLHAFAPVYGLSPSDIQNTTVHERPGFLPGHREVIVQQTIAGRPLYGSGLHLHLGENHAFLAAVGDLYGNLHWAGNAALTADQASTPAGVAIDRIVPPHGLGPVRGARFDQTIASEVAYPLGDEARPAFLFSGIVAANGIDLFDVVVDGNSGQVLEIVSRTSYSQGQVFQNVSAAPQSPQPTATIGVVPPTPNPPAYVARVTIPYTAFLTGTTLSGNLANVREYQAWTGQLRSASSGNAISSATADFSFTLNIGPGQPDIRNYPQATGTNLFYLLNSLHDYFYALGFDEAHGNFQVDNGIKGGLGNDPVIGFVQQGSGAPGQAEYASDNANMSTPGDGQSPLMAMYVFGGSGTPPTRSFFADSALDPDVVFHEFTHGVTERLVPGAFPYAGQSGAMNEGNSDFFSLNIQIPQTAPVAGAYPIGSYSVQDFTRGIRHYPYSTNTAVNPLTYANLGTIDQAPEVHNDGEIWASALWQMRGQLINALGFAEGRTRAGQLDIDALQLLPSNPTYVDFRNAILTADEGRYAGADTAQIWNGFATRGLGALAAGGLDADSMHVLSDTSIPSSAARVRLWESSFIAGETIRLLVDDSNAASSSVTLTTSSGDHEVLALGADGPEWSGSIPSSSGAVTMNDGTLELIPGDTIFATTTDTNPGAGTPALTATAAAHAPYTITTSPSAFTTSSATTLMFQGDETTYYADLAFTFPYYGHDYSRIYVNDNGLVSFGYASFIRERGIGNTGSPPLIAPFSADLDCRSPYAVYRYSGTDRFTVRWACVEWSQPANLVNVAMTIRPDGSIQFDYGSGNALSGLDGYTHLADVATVGLNRGTDMFSQTVSGYDQATSLTSAASVTFTPAVETAIATCPATFTDPTLTGGGTTIKAVHFTELRTCINQLRTLAGLSQMTFSPLSLGGAPVTAATIMQMRNALDPALSALVRPAAAYGRIPIIAGMTILASDLQEIRNAVK